MLDDKKINELKNRMKNFIADGAVKTKQKKEFVGFFLKNAEISLATSNILTAATNNPEISRQAGYKDYDGSLWIINSSYYSMFYMARALLENEGIKLSSEVSIHALTFDALVYFFYLNGKLEKRLIEEFGEAQDEASKLLGQKKAEEIIGNYFSEKNKRANYTYTMGAVAMKNKAKTSLERARTFKQYLAKLINAK
jgi:hypothetical protein